MEIKPLRKDLKKYLKDHQLEKKWLKAVNLLKSNPSHPSLNLELLEPRWRGIYSFRINRKHRALFFFTSEGEIEVFQITKHYKK